MLQIKKTVAMIKFLQQLFLLNVLEHSWL